MKILRIDFENIHSLKGIHSIDFTQPPLSQTGIFAIVGPTGSGKSTLLDVIMLALYGQMPRFDRRITTETVEKFGTVLTRGTKHAFAQVEYSTQGKKYRSKWYIEFKRVNFDYSMELSELSLNSVIETGKIIEEKKSEVPKINEQIIGLSYEQFLKSIILAQGSFAKFLKANPEERTQMLEKITGTEIYRTIGRRAFEVAKDYKNKLTEKEALLSHFQILTDDEREFIVTEKNELEHKSQKNTALIKILNEKFNIKKEIRNIQSKIETLRNQININSDDFKNFEQNYKKLEIHQKVVVYKTDLFELDALQNKMVELQEKLDKKNIDLISIIKLKNQLEVESKKIIDDLSNSEIKFNDAKPYVFEAKEINKQHDLLNQNLKNSKSNFAKINADFKNKKNDLQLKIDNQKKLTLLINQTDKWLQDNKNLENLGVDYIIVEQLFKQYNNAKIKAQEAVVKSNFAQNFVSQKLANYPQIIEDIISSLKHDFSKINTSAIDENIESLKNSYDKKIQEEQAAEKLLEISKMCIETCEKNRVLTSDLDLLNNDLKLNENIFSKTSNELEIVIKTIEELEKKHEREQLEAKYEDDRLKLEMNAECPLCGSTEHPFVTHNKRVHVELTKSSIVKQKKYKADLDKQIQTILSKISSIKTNIENVISQQKDLKLNQALQQEKFDKITEIYTHKLKIDEEGKIAEYIKKILNQKNQLQLKIKLIEQHQTIKNQLLEAENIKEKIDAIFETNLKSKEKLLPYENYYKNEKNPDNILIALKKNYNLFETNSKKIIELSTDINTLNALRADLEKQIFELSENINTSESELKNTENLVQISKKEFQDIVNVKLENLMPEVFEKLYLEKIDNLKNQNFEIKNKITELSTTIKDIEKSIVDTKNEHNLTSQKTAQKQKDLTQKLSEIGINSIQEASKNLLHEDKVIEFKNVLEILKKQQISLNQSLDDNNLRLTKLAENNDAETFEQVEKQLVTVSDLQNELNIKFGSLKNKLENDDNQRQKKAEIAKDFEHLQAETERWTKLSNLIGDANGKKFAQIAQQFTLTELIIIANIHLKKFSNRYILDKTGDTADNLFVYDVFLGMSKRSVHTLSGGETFLVSMSMALALSDLASRKTKIESLFIDEGFGTLDETTLDRALVSLEKLHSDYNRTIGIISHVPEIKERINTQIKITKNSSGYSTIEVGA
ncbi:MAG: AAA family ATPase [Bacteroidales bacterium]|nr:AAA family ATPase [Bacteroidales bacterium]